MLTARDVTRRVFSAIDIRRERACEVADTDVEGHTNPTLVRTGEVVSKPGYDPGEGRVGPSDAEERAEIFGADGYVGDVDREADEEHEEAYVNERRAQLHAVRVMAEEKDQDG